MPELPYGATLKAFNAKEVYSHLKGSPCCIICRQVLGEVAYRLRVPGQERDGVHYWSYGAEFCSEEHALHWLKHDYPKHRFDSPTIADGLPTQEQRDEWIHAFRKQGEYHKGTDRSGKWLIWLRAETIDRYWQKFKGSVEQGSLGGEAKVSTVVSRQVKQGKPYVICVYTYDYNDRADVMRIRQVLRDLGIKLPISYKADEDTNHLRYGINYTPKYRE